MNKSFLHTRSFGRIHSFVFRYRWTRNSFTGPKSFRAFREKGHDGHGLSARVLLITRITSRRTWLGWKLERTQARCAALVTQCKRFRVVCLSSVNHQGLSKIWTSRESLFCKYGETDSNLQRWRRCGSMEEKVNIIKLNLLSSLLLIKPLGTWLKRVFLRARY